MSLSDNKINSLRGFYGKGIHLYTQGITYQGWFLVPVDWGNNNYTISCFCPSGTQYLDWRYYQSIEEAFAAGRELAEEIITRLTSFKIRPVIE
ncbi:hypothetical protein AMR41_21685 [Hapalosiphon sp. MRB220]|nr:hypothetical protein AMR41_21685 [Hapalosiphon sp. MRB220]